MTSEIRLLLSEKRSGLWPRINEIAENQRKRLRTFKAVEAFLEIATKEAAYGESYSFLETLRLAGQAIPEEFEAISSSEFLRGSDLRLAPFVRSQQFIALVATLEDFLGRILLEVLCAFPEKCGKNTLKITDIILAGNVEAIIRKAVEIPIHSLFYGSPQDYRASIEDYLSIDSKTYLDDFWPDYVEMKARRDIGVHANWMKNDLYTFKVQKAHGTVEPSDFLGISSEYFVKAEETSVKLVDQITNHCEIKFKSISD